MSQEQGIQYMQSILGMTKILETQTLGQETLSAPDHETYLCMPTFYLFFYKFFSNESFQFFCVSIDENNYLEEEMPSHFKNEA